MGAFFTDGGWGMYPTSLFGLFMVMAAIRFLLRPERRTILLLVSTGVAAMASGLLSFATGVLNTFRHLELVALEDRLLIAALGTAESLHNVVLALILVVVSALIASVGALRAPRAAPSA